MTTPKKTAKISGNEARELSDLSEDIGIRFKYPNSERVYLQGSRGGGEGADLQAQIAVAPAFLQLIVGEVAHFLQMNRFFVFESEPAVKQAAAHPHGNGQSVGVEGFAQNAAAG